MFGSAYQKILRIRGRGRDSPNNNKESEYEHGSVKQYIDGKTFEFPAVSKSLSEKESFCSFNHNRFSSFSICRPRNFALLFTIKDQKNLRFRFSNTCKFPVNGICLVRKGKYLIRNGAYLFKELVKSTHGKNKSFRIFSLKELQKATNNFSADLILSDSFGRAYGGTIEDRHVAVRIPWFRHTLLNEVVSLSLIKHRNVVKLLGCCLETRDIVLVLELPPNGTLEQNIFHENHLPPRVELLWTDRLRIATEIADALAYLHSELHMTHGCLWTAEAILLDEFHSAKLGAFDFSKIQNQAESSDVETNNIRNKVIKRMDVYDFGKILLNLLGIDFGKVEERCDKVEILKYVKLNVSEKEIPQIEAYIDLLLRCRSWHEQRRNILLSVDQYYERMNEVVERDELSMKEVARELRRIRRYEQSSANNRWKRIRQSFK